MALRVSVVVEGEARKSQCGSFARIAALLLLMLLCALQAIVTQRRDDTVTATGEASAAPESGERMAYVPDYVIPSNAELVRLHDVAEDPAFECTYHNWRWMLGAFFGGYLNRTRVNPFPVRPSFRFRDFGCFTGYTIEGNGVLWAVVHEENTHNMNRLTFGIDPVTREFFDVASSKFTYTFYCATTFFDDRLVAHLPRLADRLYREHGPTARAWLARNTSFVADRLAPEQLGVDIQWVAPSSLGVLTYIPGAAFIAPIQYAKLIGQAFQQYMMQIARFWATGAMLKGNATLVLPVPYDARWYPLFDWFFPLVPGGAMFLPLDNAVYARRAHFATPAGFEVPDPCTTFFVHRFLLPQALRRVRRDRTFEYGMSATRNATRVSDRDWAAMTFPTKIAIIKDPRNSRAGDRAFIFDETAKMMMQSEGFVIVPDNTPILHRLALLNHAEVVILTYGALLDMMAMLWGRLDQPSAKRMRVIVLVSKFYLDYDEEGLMAPRWMREGTQDGLRIVIHKDGMFSLPGVWYKHVIWRDMAGGMGRFLNESHLRFAVQDCRRFNLTAAQIASGAREDFPSTYVDNNPRSRAPYYRGPRSFEDIPVIGQKCFTEEGLGIHGRPPVTDES